MINGEEGKKDYTEGELEFAIFCVENVADKLGIDAAVAYDLLAKQTDLMDGYIIPCYDVLHTQGKEYIVNDLIDRLREIGRLKFEKPNLQICLRSQETLDKYINFERSWQI